MHSAGFGVFLAVACLAGVHTNKYYCPGVTERARTCFTSKGLPYTEGSDYDDPRKVLAGLTTTALNTLCSNMSSLNYAIACTVAQVLDKCDLGTDLDPVMFPGVEQSIHYYDFLCRRKDEIDAKCADTNMKGSKACVDETVSKVRPTLHFPMSSSHTACIAIEIAYDCAGKVLESCGKKTKAILLEGMNNYLAPTVCPVKPGRPGRKPFTYPLVSSASALSQSVATFVISLLMSLIFHL